MRSMVEGARAGAAADGLSALGGKVGDAGGEGAPDPALSTAFGGPPPSAHAGEELRDER
jgi:hypothetical protein